MAAFRVCRETAITTRTHRSPRNRIRGIWATSPFLRKPEQRIRKRPTDLRAARMQIAIPIGATLGILCLLGCSGSRAKPSETTPRVVRVGQYGVGCRAFQNPRSIGPPSYSIRDIGKPRVPRLTRPEISLIKLIQDHMHSTALRFALLPEQGLIIFDAANGPCADFAPGYQVLNRTNLFYEPGEAPGFTHAVPGEVAPSAPPWLPSGPTAKTTATPRPHPRKKELPTL